jgi:cysteine-S-conjugate beta-lyase
MVGLNFPFRPALTHTECHCWVNDNYLKNNGLTKIPGGELGNFVQPCATPTEKNRRAGAPISFEPMPDGPGAPSSSMTFDFTTTLARHATDSQKWQKYAGLDILPMWVADMDFKAPQVIIDALHQRVEQGIFGYARPVPSTLEAVTTAFLQHYEWSIDPKWIVWLPGMVCGLNLAALACAEEGEEYLTLTPVYPPFTTAGRHYGRKCVRVAWSLVEDHWEIDWAALEDAVTKRTRLFYLCNPHNPIGRVWRKAELQRLADFCIKHDLVLVSDEIHCDLILDPLPHITSATLGAEIAARTITLMAPSKTYNIPGLGVTLAIIPDEKLRHKFHRAGLGLVPEVTNLGYIACEAAYRDGQPWRRALLDTLRSHRDHIVAFVKNELPGVTIEAPHEATYLAWLNVSALALEDPVSHFEQHGLGLSDGNFFGAPRNHYVRLNFGCPRATLDEGLRRLKAGVLAATSPAAPAREPA